MNDLRETSAKHVLVIDDDDVMREVLSLLLSADGYTATTAVSGEHALDLLKSLPISQQPAVLLTDLNLPGLSHAELAAHLRTVCPSPALLIAMSGSEPSPADSAPFDDFLLKPFTLAMLNATIVRARQNACTPVIDHALEETPIQTLDHTLPPVDQTFGNRSPHSPLDEAIYTRLSSVMGPDQLPRLYDMFFKDATVRLARLHSAAAQSDERAFVRESHAIMGASGMLGATQLYSLAGQMEAGSLSEANLLLPEFSCALEHLRSILDARLTTTVQIRTAKET